LKTPAGQRVIKPRQAAGQNQEQMVADTDAW
jgi:hypothetical protein